MTTARAADLDVKSAKELANEAAAQARPQTSIAVTRPGGDVVTPSRAPLVVLYDQSTPVNANSSSQNFEAAYNAYDNQAADDFVVTNGGGWNVTTVVAPGVYSTAHGSPQSMRVAFYQDALGLPGALICDFPALTYVEAPVGTFTMTLPGGCVVGAGTKWVSVVANLNFAGGGGQWFWSTVTTLTGTASQWRNPGGGFPGGCLDWSTRTTCLTQTDPDMAFRLDGDLASCQVDADCADGNLCNGIETCQAGTCVAGTSVVCNDGLFCTIDSCIPASGLCTTSPNPCSDGNPCTTDACDEAGDVCTSVGSAPIRLCNPTSIVIPGTGTAAGVANPYPSPIVVAGLPTQASVCSVELLGTNHTWRGDLDVMLASPTPTLNRTIMSDVGGSGDLINTNITLQDGAPALPTGNLASGTYAPQNSGATDTFDAPAPAPTGLAPLAGFDGINPNGTWNLWVRDDAGGDVGNMSGGWCLNLVVSSCANDGECNDGNLCNGIEACVNGSCVSGTPIDCNDNLFCTFDSCIPATGACAYAPNPCNDGNDCTSDACVEGTGCVNTSNCFTYCNTDLLTINDSAGGTPPTPATPYPSTITVAGMPSPATVAQVRLLNLSHTFPDDIDMLLVSPFDPLVNATIMSDVGLGTDLVGINLILSDAAAASMPDGGPVVSGTFKPTNIDTTTDAFPAPAPARTNLAPLSTFGTNNLNGTWSLFVIDDTNIDSGTMAGGWCLDLIPFVCTDAAQCDDGNICTLDSCVAGVCQNVADPSVCDDANPCTTDSCSPADGCGYVVIPPAADLGNTVRFTSDTDLDWASEPAGPFNVYRGSVAASYDHTCFAPGVVTTTKSDPAVPAVGTLYYYLVSRDSVCGESGLGSSFNPTNPRPYTPCP